MTESWSISTRRGSAAVLHAREPEVGTRRTADWYEVDGPGLVLGSAQRDEVIDAGACRRLGIDLVRRRSGGGAVLIMPGEMLWLDVVLPRVDALWDEDIARAMWWLGEVWAEALVANGVVGAEIHRGGVVHSTWSRLVCFDGLGAGEVVVDGRKAVGISQRRTRSWARLQSSIHLVWRPELLGELLAAPSPAPGDLSAPYLFTGDSQRLRDAVVASLSSR